MINNIIENYKDNVIKLNTKTISKNKLLEEGVFCSHKTLNKTIEIIKTKEEWSALDILTLDNSIMYNGNKIYTVLYYQLIDSTILEKFAINCIERALDYMYSLNIDLTDFYDIHDAINCKKHNGSNESIKTISDNLRNLYRLHIASSYTYLYNAVIMLLENNIEYKIYWITNNIAYYIYDINPETNNNNIFSEEQEWQVNELIRLLREYYSQLSGGI